MRILRSTRASLGGMSISLLRSYSAKVVLTFLFIYAILIQFARWQCSRDPTSVFFDAETSYIPRYSSIRSEQGSEYIERVISGNVTPGKASVNPTLCVGIASVARNGARYFRPGVGTLLENLSDSERADIHLILFIAHSDPTEHLAYNENWLHAVADTVLVYDKDTVAIEHIAELEQGEAKASAIRKGLFDYTYLLKACQAVNTPYVVVFEDDVVLLDGWYHRAQEALTKAERQTAAKGASQYLYLRLFYTEEFLGWNTEEWPAYLFCSIVTIAVVAGTLIGSRTYLPSMKAFLLNETIVFFSLIATPLLIILFFAAGRLTLLPIPAGVNEMPRFGCCSQGFIFPQSRVTDLVQWYESKHVGYIDVLTEEYADVNHEIRWAVTPTLLQHVGSKSSKVDDFTTKPKYHRSVSERIWNFAFETNNVDVLRSEHEFSNQNALL